MAYEGTAARRRPQRFDDLVGQDFVAATLKNAITTGRMAQAYLFSGPRGCGKTSTARILAKTLNCQAAVEVSAAPCGVCSHCLEIARGTSMDVIEIDGASNNGVNDVRRIKDEVLFPPNSSKYKIYIIDEVHMLSTGAFNALLKTIEEPPPYVIFIFATTEIHKVPATIKSRSQQFYFRLVPVEQIKNLLKEAADELKIRSDDEALYWMAREAEGSIRDAYTLFDQVAAFSGEYITYDKIRDKLGLVGNEMLNGVAEKCAAGEMGAALEALGEIFERGVGVEQAVGNMADYLRSLLFIKSGVTKEGILGEGVERFSPKVLAAWSAPAIEHALELFLDLYRDIRYSVSPRTEVELAVSRLAGLSSWVSAEELRRSIDEARAVLSSAGGEKKAGKQHPTQKDLREGEPKNSSPTAPPLGGQPLSGGLKAAFQARIGNQRNETTQDTTTATSAPGAYSTGDASAANAAAASSAADTTNAADATAATSAGGLPVQVEIVQKLFKGTVVG